MQVSRTVAVPCTDSVLSLSSTEHGPSLGDDIAHANSRGSRSVLHLQWGHAVHVQVFSAKQSGGDHWCRVWGGNW